MRVLVTGAAGFIGSKIVQRCISEGHDVLGLDDLSDGSLSNLAGAPEAGFVEVDLRDEEGVKRAAAGRELIFHEGAKRSVPRSLEEPVLTTEVNVIGTLNVLTAARDSGARVVAASSSSVYGDQDTFPLVESMTPRPKSPYAASKLAGEAYCSAATRSLGVRAISLRYLNVFGPGQDAHNEYAAVIPRFIVACLEGGRPVIHGDGEQSRDFTFIDDVIEANLLAARAGDDAQGRAFNIGGGAEPTSINSLLGMIAELTGSNPDPLREPARAGDVRRTEADVSAAREAFGYEPKTPIREGLKRTVDWFRAKE
jgi:nucleoside-diphosphate-sugar epimerase